MKEVALDAITYAEGRGWDPVLTCVLRTAAENDVLYGGHGDHVTGVHVVGRGVDIRTFDVDQAVVRTVAAYVNSEWIYDPERPVMRCAIIEGEGPGSSGPHMHLQSHPSTVPRTYPA